MLEQIRRLPIPYLSKFTFLDMMDILIVALFFYYFFLLIKDTRAVQIIQGVGILLFLMLLTYYLKLTTIHWILRYLLTAIAVAIPIVFQPELRRALGHLGRRGLFAAPYERMAREAITQVVDEITWASSILSQTKVGALIVIERETGLEEYIETGTLLGSNVSGKLLLSIFQQNTPLHDGAVVVKGDKIMAAGCYLPLSENVDFPADKSLGSRHRCAIGLSEQTDALVVVISEETGSISLARNGKLTRNLDPEKLKKVLLALLISPNGPQIPLWKDLMERKGNFGILKKKS